MPRFGLFSADDDDDSETPLMQYRDFHTVESFSDYSSSSDESDEEELMYSNDGDESDFSLGRTRYSLETTNESMAQYRRRWGYISNNSDAPELLNTSNDGKIQKYPPLSNYIDGSVAPTCALIRALKTPYIVQVVDDEIDKLAGLLEAAAVIEDVAVVAKQQQNLLVQHQAQWRQRAKLQIQQEMRAERLRIEQEKQEAAQGLRLLLQRTEEKAEKIKAAIRKQEEETRKQEERRRADIEQKAADEQREKELQEKLRAKEEEKARAEEEEAKRKAEAVPEYVVRANKLCAQLVQVQASVEVFDKSKLVAKRRLGFKKIVNGKVNTLAENVDKIRSVASEVSAAIAQARTEDEQNRAVVPSAPPETTRGKRYLVNLLASKVIVRVQAEGFNGYVYTL